MYRRSICTDLCPIWFVMLRSDAPAVAALRIKPRPLRQLLYDPRHIDTGQPTGLNLAVAINGAEHGTGGDVSRLQPRLQGANGKSVGIRSVGIPHLPAVSALIRF